MKAERMQLTEIPTGPIDGWSVSSMLFAALSAVLSALLYLYRGREVEHTEQIKELKDRATHLEAWVKDLQQKAEECHDDRSKLFGQIHELRGQLQKLTGGS